MARFSYIMQEAINTVPDFRRLVEYKYNDAKHVIFAGTKKESYYSEYNADAKISMIDKPSIKLSDMPSAITGLISNMSVYINHHCLDRHIRNKNVNKLRSFMNHEFIDDYIGSCNGMRSSLN